MGEETIKSFESYTREQLIEMIMTLRWQRTTAKIELKDMNIGHSWEILDRYPDLDVGKGLDGD